MKQKKITGPVPQLSLRNICDPINPVLKLTINECSETTNFSIQQQCVKTLAGYLNKCTDDDDQEYAMKLLSYMYISCTPQHPIKKTLTRILLPFQQNELLTKQFSECIKIYLRLYKESKPSEVVQDHFFNSLHTSLDLNAALTASLEHADGLLNLNLIFLKELVDCLWGRSVKISSSQVLPIYLYNATKFLLCLLQKCDVKSVTDNHKLSLIVILFEIITHIGVAYEVKCNCGHMMVLLFNGLSNILIKDSHFKDYPYLEFLIYGQDKSLLFKKLGIAIVENEAMAEMLKVCTYIGITIVAPPSVLYKCKINNEIILCYMFEKLVQSAISIKQSASQIMGISKAVTLLSSHLHYLSFDEINPIFSKGLDYVNVYIDDAPDIVKNNTHTIFKYLIKIAVKAREEGHLELHCLLLQWFKNLSGCSNFYALMVILCSEIGCSVILNENLDLPKEILNNVVCPAKAGNFVSTYEKLMQIHMKEVGSIDEWMLIWVSEITDCLLKSTGPQSILFQELFVVAFKIEPKALNNLIKKKYLNADSEIMAVLGCINYARKTGLHLNISDHLANAQDCWRNFLDYKTLEILRTHLNDEIRLLVLSAIVNSHGSTEIFTEWELNFLVEYFHYNINVPSASFRQRLVSYTKKAMIRIKDVTMVLHNKILAVETRCPDELKQKLLSELQLNTDPILNIYLNFWKLLFSTVLLPGIYSDSNYYRKSTCLEILHFTSTIKSKMEFEQLWTKNDVDNLKFILEYDTYEQNKDLASKLLSEISPHRLNFDREDIVTSYIHKCLSLALNIKPAQTISAAYMLYVCLSVPGVHKVILQILRVKDKKCIINDFEIVNKEECSLSDASFLMLLLLEIELYDCLHIARQNIQEAASLKPIHGLLFCMRHILKKENLTKKGNLSYWKRLVEIIISLCLQLGEVANTIVCHESPEGYLPNDSDMCDMDGTAKAQMVTVYGWRATKEISLLFGELALNAPFCYNKNTEGLVSEQQLRILGHYFFDLLINTKHRGAFEQASIGFTNLCSKLWILSANINTLPAQWLADISSMLYGKASDGFKSCETRRSAGIPFMVQAIVSTEPNSTSTNKHLDLIMESLLEVSDNVLLSTEQRILALNILRALYRHNRLGELVTPYCARGIIIAIKGFGCSIWGIRNSATLLFSALVSRIFGVQRLRDTELISIKNKMQSQIFFVRFPEMFNFLLQELEVASKENYHPSLYPVLLILTRLYSNKQSCDRSKVNVLLVYVELCLSNPSFKIRKLAAQVITSLIDPNKLPEIVMHTVGNLSDATIDNNYCHGLLQKLQSLHLHYDTMPFFNVETFVINTSWILLLCGEEIHWITGTHYLEILFKLILRHDPEFQNTVVFHTIIEIILWQEQRGFNFNSTFCKKYNERVFNLKLAYILHLKNYQLDNYTDKNTVCEQFIDGDLNIYSGLQHMCLNYINYIKFTECSFQDYKLFMQQDTEYSEMCKQFLQPLSDEAKSFLYNILYNTLLKAVLKDIQSSSCATDMLLLHTLPDTVKTCIEKWLVANTRRYNESSDEEYSYLSLAYIDKFLQDLTKTEITQTNLNNSIDILLKYAASTADTSLRFGLSQLLVHNKRLFYNKDHILSANQLYRIWETVFDLLEDEEEEVRKAICLLCQQDLTKDYGHFTLVSQIRVDIPEYAREQLLNQMMCILPRNDSMKLLLTLALRSKNFTSEILSEVFEEGITNTYMEMWPMAKIATQKLESILWRNGNENITSGLVCFESNNMLLISRTLYDLLSQNTIPFISHIVNDILSTIFQQSIMLLENSIVNETCCKHNLQSIINNVLDSNIVDTLDISEVLRLRMLVSVIFKV